MGRLLMFEEKDSVDLKGGSPSNGLSHIQTCELLLKKIEESGSHEQPVSNGLPIQIRLSTVSHFLHFVQIQERLASLQERSTDGIRESLQVQDLLTFLPILKTGHEIGLFTIGQRRKSLQILAEACKVRPKCCHFTLTLLTFLLSLHPCS